MSQLLEQDIDGVPIAIVGRSLMLKFPVRSEVKKKTRRPGGGRKSQTPRQRHELARRLLDQGPGDHETKWLRSLRRLRRVMAAKREDVSILPAKGTPGDKLVRFYRRRASTSNK